MRKPKKISKTWNKQKFLQITLRIHQNLRFLNLNQWNQMIREKKVVLEEKQLKTFTTRWTNFRPTKKKEILKEVISALFMHRQAKASM